MERTLANTATDRALVPRFCKGEHHQTLLNEDTCLLCGHYPNEATADRVVAQARDETGLLLLRRAVERVGGEMRAEGAT